MKKIEIIGRVWENTVGRISTIISGISIIVFSIAFIVKSCVPGKVDCLKKDLTKKQFEKCVLDERDIIDNDFFKKEWTDKRVSWELNYRGYMEDSQNILNDKIVDTTIEAHLGPWGEPEAGIVHHLIQCRMKFETEKKFIDYKRQLSSYKVNQGVLVSGTIVKPSRGNLKLDNCLIIREL